MKGWLYILIHISMSKLYRSPELRQIIHIPLTGNVYSADVQQQAVNKDKIVFSKGSWGQETEY